MTKLLLRSFMMLMLGLFFFTSCGKDEEVEPDSGAETGEAFEIDASSAKITVNLSVAGDITIDEKGICWNTSSKPTVEDETYDAGSGPDSFTGDLTGLDSNTEYHARSYYISDGKVYYGNEITFTTEDSPFVGEWSNQSGTIVYTGTANKLIFKTVNSSTSTFGWGQALAKGYISIGTEYFRNIQKVGDSYRCEALWFYGSSGQVQGVEYGSNTTITFNAAGTEMYIEAISPITGDYSSGTLYKN